MTPTPQRAEPLPASADSNEPLELTSAEALIDPSAEHSDWLQQAPERPDHNAGGRQVLGIALTILCVLWIGYAAWSAGRTLSGQPLSSPLLAQWLAAATGPLALLGLTWLIFGRTRRKEAERFTRSVVTMRSEARSLEALLAVLSQRINDSRAELTMMAQHLMQLGDEATGKLGGITQQFDTSSERLKRHGDALDRAAESARNDIGVLLDDLPRAEQITRALGDQLRDIAGDTNIKTTALGQQVGALAEQARAAESIVSDATDRLAVRLSEIDQAGVLAGSRLGDAEAAMSSTLDTLLTRTSASLDQIRSGIDVQAQAVAALVQQASAGIGRAGAEAAESLAANVDHANNSLSALSNRVAEQDRASQHMIAEIERGLALVDERFSNLAVQGDERANRFLESLSRARIELDALAGQASSNDLAIGAVAERTLALRETVDRLTGDIRDNLGTAIGEAHGGAERLAQAAAAVRPEIGWIRDASADAAARLGTTGQAIAEQQNELAALIASIDEGVSGAEGRLSDFASALSEVKGEAANLTAETGPAMIAALVQVKEAASHAAERARDAIEAIIPASAGRLSEETRDALERVIRDSVEEQLREVESVAERAVESARAASERLTQQMLSLGQSAAALEAHVEATQTEQREKDSEAFARRVSLLIDSMNSAAIDVGKILSDEIDDKAWDSYLKGNRGVFTSRAVRLMGGSESRAIRSHYESDVEFQRSVNRYVHDFEAMLRRVLAERDGGMIAVTLMSSDMGKLYAALAQAIDRRR